MNTDLPTGAPTRSRRRRVLAALSALAVVALVVLAVVVLGRGDDRAAASGGSASPTTAAPAAATAAAPALPAPLPTPVPAGPTGTVDDAPPSLPPVALDQTAAAGDGITASLTSIEAIQGTATGPGNVSGPALRVTVRLTNGTAAPVALGGVSVDLASGNELTPASPLNDPSAAPFTGMVAPGHQAEGVYVFSIPAQSRDSVTVSVGYQAGAPIMVFTGSAR
jgi:hypothetical protein